jgi:TM2 domain-containing membrane protein YozV/RNA polymerase subunit RPABC4/transcription elongation factor Spt4
MHCRNCGKQIDDKAAVCIHCGVPPKASTQFCFNCGNATTSDQAICMSCGVALATRGTGQKTKSTALVLALLIGVFGAHKFYMGSWGWGIVHLVLCATVALFPVAVLITLVDMVRMILMTDEEFRIKASAFEAKGPFGYFW